MWLCCKVIFLQKEERKTQDFGLGKINIIIMFINALLKLSLV